MANLTTTGQAFFRFYAELNDFLPPIQRGLTTEYRFCGHPGIKDPIEAQGVPHTEVELILVNGKSRGFDYQLHSGDRVAVYPVFESLDVTPLVKLRKEPLRQTSFVLDVHLGKLARLLRLLGFDTLYRNDYDDPEIIAISLAEHRIILTRDRRLLFDKRITHGYFIRSDNPLEQARDVLRRFQLESVVRPFHRCLLCNGTIEPVARESVKHRVQPKTARYYREFHHCRQCDRVYWRGPHVRHLEEQLRAVLGQ